MEKKNKNYNKVCTILHVNFAILAYAGTEFSHWQQWQQKQVSIY